MGVDLFLLAKILHLICRANLQLRGCFLLNEEKSYETFFYNDRFHSKQIGKYTDSFLNAVKDTYSKLQNFVAERPINLGVKVLGSV